MASKLPATKATVDAVPTAESTGNVNGSVVLTNGKGIAVPARETVDFIEGQVTMEDVRERARKQFRGLPSLDDCLQRAEAGERETSPNVFVERFKEALLSHEQVSNLIGEQRWMMSRISESVDHLLDMDWKEDTVVIGADGLRGNLVGEGMFSKVYEVVQEGQDRVVKLFKPHHSVRKVDEAEERFLDEIAVLEAIGGQGAPRIISKGFLRPREPFFVMERIHGWTLRSLIRKADSRPLPYGLSVDLMTLICASLHSIHDKRIIHRDLKPENIMLDHAGRVLIVDFGLHRSESSEGTRLTQTGEGMGTPNYMPPELFDSAKHATKKVDMYAVGCMGYEMLTGNVPFPASRTLHAAKLHTHQKPDLSKVPEDMRDILEGLLAKDPGGRMSVKEALEALLPHSSFYGTYKSPDALVQEMRSLPGMPLDASADPKAVQQGGTLVASPEAVYAHFMERANERPIVVQPEMHTETALSWWRRPVTVGLGGAGIVCGTLLSIALMLRENGDPIEPGPKGDDGVKKINVVPTRPRSIAVRLSEDKKKSAITFLAHDPEKCFSIPEGVLIYRGGEEIGSVTKINLDKNLIEDIRKKNGDALADKFATGPMMGRYRRVVDGQEVQYLYISRVGDLVENEQECVAIATKSTSEHPLLKVMGLSPVIVGPNGALVNPKMASKFAMRHSFFSGYDLQGISIDPSVEKYNGWKSDHLLKIFRDEAERRGATSNVATPNGDGQKGKVPPAKKSVQLIPDRLNDLPNRYGVAVDGVPDTRKDVQRRVSEAIMEQRGVRYRSHAVV